MSDQTPLTWLWVVRKARGMTQRELATAAGVTNVLISRLETGDRQPRMATAIKLSKALGVDAETLFPDEG